MTCVAGPSYCSYTQVNRMSTGEEGSESAGQVAEREPPPIEFLRNSAHTTVCNIMLSFSKIYYIVRLTVADFIHLPYLLTFLFQLLTITTNYFEGFHTSNILKAVLRIQIRPDPN